jgi:putative transcriptional regulator
LKFKKKLVSRIRELRDEKKLNQQDLANLCGVSRQTIYYLENLEAYNPSLSLSLKISEIFGKPIEDIFYFQPIIKDIIGKKTVDEIEKLSDKIKISRDRIMKLKDIEEEMLSHEFREAELSKIAKALNMKFEELFMQDDELL